MVMIGSNASALSTLVLKAQDELQGLLRKELGNAVVTSKSRSYAFFRISYLRAVSQLRPSFFDDVEDFLEQDMRDAEWAKRQRFNELKKVWIKYDKISPDKARDLGTEDQEIENDLDMIEEEIQEEWQDFAEELLDMFDDEDEEEDFGDEDDLEDLDHWRAERKRMRQDASLLKRRILERTMQRRAREEVEERKRAIEEHERRMEELVEKARRAQKAAVVHEAALEALSPTRKSKQGMTSWSSMRGLQTHDDSDYMASPTRSPTRALSPNGKKWTSMRTMPIHEDDSSISTPTRGLSPSKKLAERLCMQSNVKKDDDFYASCPSKLSLTKDEEDEKETPLPSQPKNKPKKKSSGSSKDSEGDGSPKKKSKSKKSKDGEISKSTHSDSKGSKKSKGSSSKDGEISKSKQDEAGEKKKKKKKTHREPKHPEAPKTPVVKRLQSGRRSSIMHLACPRIEEDEPESPSRTKSTSMPVRPSLDSPEPSPREERIQKSPSPPDNAATARQMPGKSSSGNAVSSLRERFSHPSTPKLPVHQSFSGRSARGVGSLPAAPSLSGDGTEDTEPRKISPNSLKSILKTLENHQMISTDELVKALTDLYLLARDRPNTRQEFVGGRGNTLLHDILDLYHQENEPVTRACLRAIVPLILHDKNRDALALLGVIETAMVGMLFHRECAELQEEGCDALSNFAKSRKYQDWIVASNGLQVLLKTQSAFLEDDNVQAACFRCVAQLVFDHCANSRQFAAQSGIKHIMGAVNMPEHENSVKLHKAALQALGTLAKNDEVNRGKIAKEDGICLTLLAMESFANDEELQQYACQALCALATDHAQNCRSIYDQGGLRMVSKVMKDHFKHEGVQEGALSLLKQMTEDDEVSTKFAEGGGIDRILMAMRNFNTSVIHEQGCLTLCNMAIQEENKDTIRNLGGIRTIVSAMRLLPKSTFVQKSGCRALDSLATNEPSKVTIAASGGVSTMLAAMKNHIAAAGVQALAITALRKLATITRNRNIMKTNDGIETVEQAMLKYPNHAHLQENGKALVKLLDPTRALTQPEPLVASSVQNRQRKAPEAAFDGDTAEEQAIANEAEEGNSTEPARDGADEEEDGDDEEPVGDGADEEEEDEEDDAIGTEADDDGDNIEEEERVVDAETLVVGAKRPDAPGFRAGRLMAS